MSAKPLNEWNEQPDPVTLDYHLRQWTEPYRSTVHFAKFIEDRMSSTKWVVDAACGGGAPTAYLAETYPDAAFLGIDISKELIDIAHSKRLFSENLSFACEDICNPSPRFGVDAVTLQQALSWMPDYQEPLRQLCSRLHPKWLAFSTLIYDGDIDTKIVVTEHKRPASIATWANWAISGLRPNGSKSMLNSDGPLILILCRPGLRAISNTAARSTCPGAL